MILTENGVLKLMQRIKSFITSQLNTKASSVHTHTLSEIDDLSNLSMGGGVYSKSEVDTLLTDYIPKSGGGVISGTTFNRTVNDSSVTLCGGTGWDYGASITLSGKDRTDNNGNIIIRAKDNSNVTDFILNPNGTATWGNKNLAMEEDFIPRGGGAVISGTTLKRTTDNGVLALNGGSQSFKSGGGAEFYGMYEPSSPGMVRFVPAITDTFTIMDLKPNGTWTWTGQPCQTASDQRLKQQISKIDNALLDAWEDVEPVQFKYNDAVNEKGSNARLHTGYVVQQIDEACQKHDVDISEYGLYCHEEYPERTEEVTIENEDGTTSKETRVVEPASEHYSLRYTETLVVECAYLRREINKLKEELKQLKTR